MSTDRHRLARRFFALDATERKRFLDKLRESGIRFDRLPLVGGIHDREAPLAPVQRRLWLLHRLDPNDNAYHLTGSFELDGPVVLAELTAALEAIQRRHAPLRTRFVDRDGTPRQVIDTAPPLTLVHHDMSDASPEAVQALADDHAQTAFDLDQGPPYRVQAIRLGPRRWRMQLVMHHIIADAWSIGIFLADLAQGLQAEDGAEPSLAPLVVQYADYAVWQQACLEAGEHDRQLAFWRRQLEPGQPPLLVPYDKPVTAGRPRMAAAIRVTLPPVRDLASAGRATPFTVMLAAWMWTLAVHSGRFDIPVGVPVADRDRPETAPQIGFFVNTVVMRGQVDPAWSMADWIARLQAQVLDVQDNRTLPFDRLVEAIAPQRAADETPLFQVLFNHRPHAKLSEQLTPEISLQSLAQGVPHALFDLALDVDEAPDGRSTATLTYACDRFAAETAARLAAMLERVVNAFIRDPLACLGSLSLLSGSEVAQLGAWSYRAGTYDPDADLVDLIRHHARARPDAVALVHGKDQFTYAGLDQHTTNLARRLRAHGAGPETVVGVALQRGTSMIAACIACLKAGAAFLPLDPDYPAERLRHMLDDGNAALVLTTTDCADRLPDTGNIQILAIDQRPQDVPDTALPPPHPDQLAYLIYTSGSTGTPKGVAVTRRGLAMHVQTIGRRYAMTPEDVELHFASISFDGAIERWAVPLACGCKLVIRDQTLWSAEQTCQALVDHAVTIVCFPPSYVGPLLDWIDHARPDLAVRSWTLGGEAFTRETYHRLQRVVRPPRIINGYGPTETVVTPLIWEAGPDTPLDSAYAPIGTPVGERRAYVLDHTLNPVPPGAVGELYIGGEVGLARGYHNRPELTAERFLPDPFGPPGERMYRTGDRVRWRDDGVMDYLGRADQQIKIRGFRIEPGEIEAQLMALPQVRDAVVVAQGGPAGGSQASAVLVAYVVAAGPLDPRTIQRQLGDHLPAHMVPARIVRLDGLPLTPAGKVDRRALPDPAPEPVRSEAPETEAELAIAAIWQRLLGRDRIGRQDDFFELGGDSIVALQVVGQARQAGWVLKPSHLFQHQTLAAVAAAAQRHTQTDTPQEPVTGDAPLTPIQAHFFALRPPKSSHWNQHLWLEARRPLDTDLLGTALLALRDHHDALRLRFHQEAGRWRQTFMAPDALPRDIVWRHTTDDDAEAERLCTAAQRSLDIEAGVLMRALHLSRAGHPDRLLLTIHHLAVDGVSWRILLEDLQRAYEQAVAGQQIRLPAKTASLKDWIAALAAWPDAEDHLAFWQQQDAGAPEESAVIGNCDRRTLSLDAATTRALLRTERDITATLVAALVQAQGKALTVNLEGHGRRTDVVASDLDLSRTVGWFTSLYPLSLDWYPDPGDCLAAAVDRLRRADRDGGLGYGVLRFGHSAGSRLPGLAPVTMNYLGQYRPDTAADWLTPIAGGGEPQAPENPLAAPLTVNAHVAGDALHLDWVFSLAHHTPAEIDTLAQRYQEALSALLAPSGHDAKPDRRISVSLASADTEWAPLFCPHPVTGRVNGYGAIARCLQGHRAMFGLQSLSCVNPGHFDDSLTQIADRYTETIRQTQPEGPYALLGWSLGGALALDIAQRLERAGQRVAFLGLLDPFVPGFEVFEDQWPAPQARRALAAQLQTLLPGATDAALGDCLDRLPAAMPRQWPHVFSRWLEQQRVGALDAEGAGELLFSWALDQHHRRLCDGYALPSVQTPVHAWWAGRPERHGPAPWDALARTVRVVFNRVVASDHLGIVRDPDCLADLERIFTSSTARTGVNDVVQL